MPRLLFMVVSCLVCLDYDFFFVLANLILISPNFPCYFVYACFWALFSIGNDRCTIEGHWFYYDK